MILRGFAILVGLALLAAACHATVTYGGGYGTPHAPIPIAIAAGVGVGALAIGAAWSQRRRALSVAILLALVCGELFGLVMTGERLIEAREAKLAPLRAAQEARSNLERHIAGLDAKLAKLSSPRLEAALEAKRRVDQTITTKAAERGCATNCRRLLEAQREAAEVELAAARAASEADRQALRGRQSTARAELDRLNVPETVSPLADRLGVKPWVLDLTVAALGSVAANGLAAVLLAFGAHVPKRREPRSAKTVSADPAIARLPPPDPELSDREHVAAFLMEAIEPDPDGIVSLRDLADRYDAFVADTGNALPKKRLGEQLALITRAIGLKSDAVDGDFVLRGARMKIQ